MKTAQGFNQMASDPRWVMTTGVMRGMVKDLNKLAPRPDGKGHGGSLSMKSDHRAAVGAGSRDSMLATMMIDVFFGGAINTALTEGLGLPDWLGGIDVSNAVDTYDEYWTDRQQSRGNNRENGEYELGEKGVLSGGFNMTNRRRGPTNKATEWDLYMRDLPTRRVLEQNLSGMSRKLDNIQNEYRAKPAGMVLGM